MCGVMTGGEWFNDFGREFRDYGRVEEGPEDLLGEVRKQLSRRKRRANLQVLGSDDRDSPGSGDS